MFADAMIHEIMEFGVDGDLSHYCLSKVFVPAEDLDAAKRNAEHGKLSEEDWICLLTAKRRGYCCVTNDERLRRRCESENIPTIRGHRLILVYAPKAESPLSTRELSAIRFSTRTRTKRRLLSKTSIEALRIWRANWVKNRPRKQTNERNQRRLRRETASTTPAPSAPNRG